MTTAASYSTVVQDLYVAYFGRPADYFGLQNFEAQLAAADAPTTLAGLEAAYSTNAAVKSLVDSFGTSAESIALYGSGSTASFVTAIFENLLNRPPAVSGLTFWVEQIESGAVTQGDAALAIAAGAIANTTAQGLLDQEAIANKVAVATAFTTALGASSTQIVDYSGSAAATDARLLLAGVTSSTTPADVNVQTTINNIVAGNTNHTYNLTTGVDTIVGGPGNNTFNAILDANPSVSGGPAATLQSFDTITGGTLNNTLNITDFGTGSDMTIPTGATITGITTLNINSLEGVDGNYSSWADLTALNVKASTGTDNVTVGSNVALSVVDSLGNVTTTGGLTVSVTTDTSHAVSVTGGAATSAVSITGGDGGLVEDANYGTSTANTITSVSLTGSHNTTTIQSNALTSLTVAGESYGSVVVDAAAGTRTLDLTINGDAFATFVDSTATTVDVSAVTAASTPIAMQFATATAISFDDAVGVAFIEGGNLEASNAKALTISGAGYFTASTYDLNAAAAINASGSSGVDTIELASASSGALTQSFVGGTGQDIVWIGAGQTGAVAGGSATDNEIVLSNALAATVTDIAAVTHFSIFGVAGSTSGVFDMSKVSGYSAFDVQGSGGNVTFTNAATGSSLSLEGGNSHIVTLQTIDTTGATDSVNVSIGTTTTDGNTYAQVTLEDSNFVGTATVNLTSNVSQSGSANTLTTLGDNDLVTLNIGGTGTVSIGTILSHSTSLTINNSAVNGSAISNYIETLTDNYLTSLTFGGADGIDVNSLSTTSASLTITDNNASTLVIATLADTSLTSATFTNSVNTTAATFHIQNTLTEAGLATLNLNGNVTVSVTGDTVTSGITVAGSTDNASVSLNFSTAATAAGKTDSVALGNGNDAVALGAGVGIGAGTPAVPGTYETATVTWAALAGAGTETIGGITVTATGAETATTVADAVSAILGGGTWTGVTATTSGTYVLSGLSGDTTVLTAASAGVMADPGLSATNSNGTAPTDTVTTVGTAGTPAIPSSTTASTHIVTLGTGTDAVSDATAGSTTISITGSSTSVDSIVANEAQTVHITAGNGTDAISATAAGASINISVGTGVNAITVGADTTGTISLGVHTGSDAISLGASGTSLTAIEKISGLNNSTTDTLTFSGDISTIASVTQVTAGSVIGSHGDTTLLADWVAAATGATGSAITGTAHSVVWFQYQGNTYLVETVGADTGSLATGDTLVELTGTSYTFAHASSATNTSGALHFLG